MLVIETDRHRTPTRDDLVKFLGACQDAAREDAHFKLASITLRVRHIDPLAVLESIYEADQAHMYLENPQLDFALAGAEPVLQFEASGAQRFADARAFAEEVLEHTIAVGDVGMPFGGPQFFTAFTFYEDPEPGEGFPPGMILVPRWQVARLGGNFAAVANCRVDPASDVAQLADRIWSAHQKFSSFAYDAVPEPDPAVLQEQREAGGEGTAAEGVYPAAVLRALERIREGRYGKIVLARARDLIFDRTFRPLNTLNRLRSRFPGCYAFSVQARPEESFIGATPERLVRVRDGELLTEAIAGSEKRGATAQEDAQLARALLSSEKDRREHEHVVQSIQRRLTALGISSEVSEFPELLRLANVQHLRSPIRARIASGVHLLDAVEALHPTPAVGGAPREAAVADIPSFEQIHRSLYAGTLGCFGHDGNGEFVVALRCARIRQNEVRLYAGAGIVEGSDPEKEQRETEVKMRALLDGIQDPH